MLLSYHDSVDAVSREGNGDACVTLSRGIPTLKSESREPTFSDDNNLDTDYGDCGGGQRADGRAVLCLLLLGDGRLGANAGVGGNEGHAADQPDDLESCISERFLWNRSGLFARHDLSAWQRPPEYGWAITGACVYLFGGFMVTAVFNVPLNNDLDKLPPDAAESHDEWTRYLRLWTRWNHLRTAACILACVLLTIGLP